MVDDGKYLVHVSTHSRLKAAGKTVIAVRNSSYCFNTQPPEGGWESLTGRQLCFLCFNTQPPEGGWLLQRHGLPLYRRFNTQPPEGGWLFD